MMMDWPPQMAHLDLVALRGVLAVALGQAVVAGPDEAALCLAGRDGKVVQPHGALGASHL